MKKNAPIRKTAMMGTQTKAAFWIQMSDVLPALTSWLGSPPNMPKVIAQGMRNCMTLTPALPNPALRPSESPCIRFGKKKLMLDIDDANAPPPTPESAANRTSVRNGVSGFCSANPAATAGRMSSNVVMNFTLRPPQSEIMKELGMRSVAPARPATAGRLKSSAR